MVKLDAPAALRNRDPIAAVLADALPATGRVLMIAEGSGIHAVHMARRFPHLRWLPSDPDPAARASIAAFRAEANLANLDEPIDLDVIRDGWPVEQADAIVCINLVHISPWTATQGLLAGAARTLPPGGVLYVYGPFLRRGVATAPSNVTFDQSLRARNPAWGLRSVEDVEILAAAAGLRLETIVGMPANNLSLLFRKAAK
jgi:SAM-dependent methyltransferase